VCRSAAHQHKEHEEIVKNIQQDEEVWNIDWTSTISLYQSMKQTQNEDMQHDHCSCFVLVRYYKQLNDLQNIFRYNHLVFTVYPVKDWKINQACMDMLLQEAKERGVKKIVCFSDNGSSFHCAMQWEWQCSLIQDKFAIEYQGHYYPAGEGKSDW
jgi:hypothetical protein